MPKVIQGVAMVCGGAMAVIGRVLDSAADRHDRSHRGELNLLWRESQGRRS